ncbi:MAG: SlyX family protein [Pseudomonadota bacterium]
MTDQDPENRIARLEEHIAHQANTIDELSEQLARQWKIVEKIQNKQEKLIERFLALEAQSANTAPVTKPPHY